MKAYEIYEPFGIDALTLVDRPEPQPGPGQVLVRIRAVSLNYRDLLVVKGVWRPGGDVGDGTPDGAALASAAQPRPGVTPEKPGPCGLLASPGGLPAGPP